MFILRTPQISEDVINYEFGEESITITMGGETDTFDFASMPDGEAELLETTLPYNALLKARKEEGVLYLTILDPVTAEVYQEYTPKWEEVINVEDQVE